MDVSNRLGLPYLAAAQSQKHVTHNEALRLLDALVQIAVRERDRVAPPAQPVEGDRYLVAAQPTGIFTGHAGALAAFDDGGWRFAPPAAGWLCYVAAEGILLVHDGTAWRDLAGMLKSIGPLQALGIGTGVDAGNPLSAKLNNALFAARASTEGGSGDLRVKFNKEKPAATASLLYQSAWSGRAEAGLCGDDAFRIKVSADGAAWRDALIIDPASGAASFPSGLAGVPGATPSDLRNQVVNGDFGCAQRGAGPFAWGASPSFSFDRWLTQAAAAVTGQVSRTAFAPGQADVPGGRFFVTLALTQAGPTAAPEFTTRIEDVGRLAGRTLTLSFSYRTASSAFACDLAQNLGAGGSAAVTGLSPLALPASPAWTRRSLTLSLPPVAGKTVGAGSYTALRFVLTGGAAAGALDLADVQLEEGPLATAFARRPPALETLLCRRFFRRQVVAQNVTDLGQEMRKVPVQSGTGPYDYDAEL